MATPVQQEKFVLAHHNASNGGHWFKSEAYTAERIEAIKDPEGGTVENPATAVPSPFARFDLVRTAFRNLGSNTGLTGTAMDAKLVSDALDIGELFFRLSTVKDKVRVVVWDKDLEMKELLEDHSHPGHEQLGKTLRLFLEDDAASYNFDRMDKLFLLEYDYQVIGATSPSTMFVATGNDVKLNISLGKHKVLSGDYLPLYKRDGDFQKFIYRFFHAYQLTNTMKEMSTYLEASLKMLVAENKSLHGEINAIRNQKPKEVQDQLVELYDSIEAGGSEGSICEVLQYELRQIKGDDINAVIALSDFIIKPSKLGVAGKLPLVLQNDFSRSWRYVNDKWDGKTIRVPYADREPLAKRKLPGTAFTYPYLTVDDFLEPYLVRTLFPLNNELYQTATVKGDGKKGYLLPLKRAFFEYFGTEDLRKTTPQPMLEMEELAGGTGVRVRLRIPVQTQRETITLERIYIPTTDAAIAQPQIDAANNQGVLIEQRFTLAITPLVRTEDADIMSEYRVFLVDNDERIFQGNNYALNFYQQAQNDALEGTAIRKTQRTRKGELAGININTLIWEIDGSFDYIQLSNGNGASALLVPIFKVHKPTESYTFGVDFGTSNSHIEYAKSAGKDMPQPLELTEPHFFATLHAPGHTFTQGLLLPEMLEHDAMPGRVSQKDKYWLPMRTAIHLRKDFKFSGTSLVAPGDATVALWYERKRYEDAIMDVYTNLKWSNYAEDTEGKDGKLVEAYIENLMFLIRAKLLLNNGDLRKTQIVWTYPTSMTRQRQKALTKKWDHLFGKYVFNASQQDAKSGDNSSSLKECPESVAPYFYYAEYERVQAFGASVLSVDIGGGTTDAVLYQEDKVLGRTSFRFAGEALYGDGFNSNKEQNGFLLRHRGVIERQLTDAGAAYWVQVLDQIANQTSRSTDVISYFFSLASNKELKDKKVGVNYANILEADDDMKIIFLSFFAAIVYHIAHWAKLNGVTEIPRYIVFTGNGSRMLPFLDSQVKRFEDLSMLSKLIFASVLDDIPMPEKLDKDALKAWQEKAEKADMDIVLVKDPKVVTARGAVVASRKPAVAKIANVVHSGIPQEPNAENLMYDKLNEAHLKDGIAHYEAFITLLFGIHEKQLLNLRDTFGIPAEQIEFYKRVLKKDAGAYQKMGVKAKQDELRSAEQESLSETLFFYPLTGTLNNLAYEIANKAK